MEETPGRASLEKLGCRTPPQLHAGGVGRHQQQHVCYSECNVSNECNEPTSCILQHIGTHGGEVMYFGCVCFTGELGFSYCDDICMFVVNKQFELFEFVFDSVFVNLQYDEISLNFTAGSMSLCCICGHVVVFGLSVRLSWYPMWMRWLM